MADLRRSELVGPPKGSTSTYATVGQTKRNFFSRKQDHSIIDLPKQVSFSRSATQHSVDLPEKFLVEAHRTILLLDCFCFLQSFIFNSTNKQNKSAVTSTSI
jgi:hypothetical protein